MRYQRITFLIVVCLELTAFIAPTYASDYVVVVSKETRATQDWAEVVESLVEKHDASVVEYEASVSETLPELKEQFPRYACFVTRHEDVDREFVKQIYELTIRFDDDPYTDTFWGILTGFDAGNALEIASHHEPLTIKKVLSGTDFAIDMVGEGEWYDELVKNKHVKKLPGESAQTLNGPDDTTEALAESLSQYKPDLLITSGHATERNWQLGFRYRNGYFLSKAGQMVGQDSHQKLFEIDSPNPKVYLPIGNCLMGNINGPDSMALAWMNDVGVKQMLGYTEPTWFGYMGWGVLDYFVEQPGRYSLTEAFFANHHALVHRLGLSETAQQDVRGLTFDRDVVAFYGDPKWSAKMAAQKCYYDQKLTIDGDLYTLVITPNRGEHSFEPVNTNGSQRGGRPIVQYLPHRISAVEILDGQNLNPVVTDDFVLVPNPLQCESDQPLVVRFKAGRLPNHNPTRKF